MLRPALPRVFWAGVPNDEGSKNFCPGPALPR